MPSTLLTILDFQIFRIVFGALVRLCVAADPGFFFFFLEQEPKNPPKKKNVIFFGGGLSQR